MSQVPQDIRNAMATTLCAVMRARGTCATPDCTFSHEKHMFLCPNEQDDGSCKAAYCRYHHQCDSNGHALAAGQSGLRVPQAAAGQPTQRGERILAPTRPVDKPASGSALAAKPQPRESVPAAEPPKSVVAAPRAPPQSPPVAITRWNAPDPITTNPVERDMVSLFQYPIRCPLDLSDLERRQMMDYASKLLSHHKPQFQRYAVRVISEPLSHTHFLDIVNILMRDETAQATFGVVIFLTRFIPLARLLGQEYWNIDASVQEVFRKFLKNIFPDEVYTIYIIARGIASFVGFMGTEDEIDWVAYYVDMLHCFLNMARYSVQHEKTAGFPACDYWMIRFVEMVRDSWFEQPSVSENVAINVPARPKKDVIFDAIAELLTAYKISEYFAPSTYEKGQRRYLDDIRRLDCVEFSQKGTCPGAEDESCFYAHRASLVEKHVKKSNEKFKSMESWLKFGSHHDKITADDLKAYWTQGLEFLAEGNVEFIFDSLMRKEGTFLISRTLELRSSSESDFDISCIKAFATIISDERLEEYNQKQSKVPIIADVLAENGKFFIDWANDIEVGLSKKPASTPHLEASRLLIGLSRFMLSFSPINKLDGETKAALVNLCRIITENHSEGSQPSVEASAVADRLGLLIRRNLLEGVIEIIDRDAPDIDAANYDDSAPLDFSDDEKRREDTLFEEVEPGESLIDMEPIVGVQDPASEELIQFEPILPTRTTRDTTQFGHFHKENLGSVSLQELAELELNNIPAIQALTIGTNTGRASTTTDALSEVAPAAIEDPRVCLVKTDTVVSKQAVSRATDPSVDGDYEDENLPDDYSPSPNNVSGLTSQQLLDEALKSLTDFFEFDLIRPAARLNEMDDKGHFIILKVFFTAEHLHTNSGGAGPDVTIFSHFLPFLQIVSHKLAKHDLDAEPGWKSIMAALFRKLWAPGEFIDFFRNSLRDFYLLHEDRARFSSEHRKLYRKATENMLRLLTALAKTNQLPKVDGSFQTLILRFLRIFTEEYRPGVAVFPEISSIETDISQGLGTTEQTRRDRDPLSYHRWTRSHALMNVLIVRLGLGGFFKQVPGEVGRDPQPRPLYKYPNTFTCPDRKRSRCEFAAHCQFSHEAEEAGTPDSVSSFGSDSESGSDAATERGDGFLMVPGQQIGYQRRSVISASEDESALSVNSQSTAIDAEDVAYI